MLFPSGSVVCVGRQHTNLQSAVMAMLSVSKYAHIISFLGLVSQWRTRVAF